MNLRELRPADTVESVLPLSGQFGVDSLVLLKKDPWVYLANRFDSRSLVTSCGKGWSKESATASALFEAIENAVAESEPSIDLIESAARLDERGIQHIACESFFKRRTNLDWADGRLQKISWSAGEELISDQVCYVPSGILRLFPANPLTERLTFRASSNGLASGNSRSEAISHAILELIERDLVYDFAAMSGSNRAMRLLNSQTLPMEVQRPLASALAQDSSLCLALFKLGRDEDVPAVLAEIFDRNSARVFARGAGCDVCLSDAVLRAASEAFQLLAVSQRPGYREDFNGAINLGVSVDLKGESTGLVAGDLPFKEKRLPATTTAELYGFLVEHLRQRGIKQIACVTRLSTSTVTVVQCLSNDFKFLHE